MRLHRSGRGGSSSLLSWVCLCLCVWLLHPSLLSCTAVDATSSVACPVGTGLLSCALLQAEKQWRQQGEVVPMPVDQQVQGAAGGGTGNGSTCSVISTLCAQLAPTSPAVARRLGCCRPHNVRYLFNVRVSRSAVTVFSAGAAAGSSGSGRSMNTTLHGGDCAGGQGQALRPLPTVTSLVPGPAAGGAGAGAGAKEAFTLPLSLSTLPFPSSPDSGSGSSSAPQDAGCRPQDVVDGTLHVIGRSTAHNLFHALNDNVLPFLAHVVQDAYLAPHWAHRPRHILFTPHAQRMRTRDGAGAAAGRDVPHMQLLELAADKIVRLPPSASAHAASGTAAGQQRLCYRRVVWGSGPRLLYNHALVQLRRRTVELLRLLALRAAPAAAHVPEVFTYTNTNTTVPAGALLPAAAAAAAAPALLQLQGRPLRVVLYSRGRGSSGLGRTMSHEERLVDALRAAGAQVHVHGAGTSADSLMSPAAAAAFAPPPPPPPLGTQLALAVHADVVMGQHGAGLAHALFAARGCIVLEFKTVYGYQLDLFRLAADAVQGTHVHIDVHSLSSKAVELDVRLVDRTIAALRLAVELAQGHRQGGGGGGGAGGGAGEGDWNRLRKMDGSPQDTVQWQGGLHGLETPATTHLLGPDSAGLARLCVRSDLRAYWSHLKTDLSGVCLACSGGGGSGGGDKMK